MRRPSRHAALKIYHSQTVDELRFHMDPTHIRLYTIGHSDRSLEEFLQVLRATDIQCLVDVRAYPQSRRHPQFDEATLREELAAQGIVYHSAGRQLGGLRQPKTESIHHALSSPSLRAYADYMESDVFQRAAAQLLRLASQTRCALMCAERLPDDCHRSLLADYLSLQGVHITHLIDGETPREHLLHSAARRESAHLIYDRHSQADLPLGD